MLSTKAEKLKILLDKSNMRMAYYQSMVAELNEMQQKTDDPELRALLIAEEEVFLDAWQASRSTYERLLFQYEQETGY